MKLVNADTLAAAVHWGFIDSETGDFIEVGDAGMQRRWCPPDPRLDALLAAARLTVARHMDTPGSFAAVHVYAVQALRDALAAFEEKVPAESSDDFLRRYDGEGLGGT